MATITAEQTNVRTAEAPAIGNGVLLPTHRQLIIPRGLISRFNSNAFTFTPEQKERPFSVDPQEAASKTPPAIHHLVDYLMEQGVWREEPDLAVVRRNDRFHRLVSDPMRQENDRFVGGLAVINLQGAMRLQTFEPVSTEVHQYPVAPDGSTVIIDAETYHAVTSSGTVGRGFNLVIGHQVLGYEIPELSEIPGSGRD